MSWRRGRPVSCSYPDGHVSPLTALFAFAVFQDKPEIPPSQAQVQAKHIMSERSSYVASLLRLLRNRPFMLLVLSYGGFLLKTLNYLWNKSNRRKGKHGTILIDRLKACCYQVSPFILYRDKCWLLIQCFHPVESDDHWILSGMFCHRSLCMVYRDWSWFDFFCSRRNLCSFM